MQLPCAPEAIAAEEAAQQAKRAQQEREVYNRDVQAVTELRRCMRKIVASLIAKSKYADFLYPITPGSDPEAYYKVSIPCRSSFGHMSRVTYPLTKSLRSAMSEAFKYAYC